MSEFGANKYAWKGWEKADNGFDRYSDALVRHISKEAVELLDPDSKLTHAAHTAWNALARLELLTRQMEYEKCHTSKIPTDTTLLYEGYHRVPPASLISSSIRASKDTSTILVNPISPITTSSALLNVANKKFTEE